MLILDHGGVFFNLSQREKTSYNRFLVMLDLDDVPMSIKISRVELNEQTIKQSSILRFVGLHYVVNTSLFTHAMTTFLWLLDGEVRQ